MIDTALTTDARPAAALRLHREPPPPPAQSSGHLLPQSGEKEEATDADLMTRVRGGDSAAFALLYERHKGWVVALAYRFCGDRDLAMDVLQETFAFLLRRSPTLTLDGRLTTYLFPAVRNLSQTARRKKMRLGGSEVVEHHAERDGTQGGSSGDRRATQNEDDELRRVVAALPEAQRELIYMRYVAGMTPTEIAVVLGVPVGTAKSRLFAAVRAVESGLSNLGR